MLRAEMLDTEDEKNKLRSVPVIFAEQSGGTQTGEQRKVVWSVLTLAKSFHCSVRSSPHEYALRLQSLFRFLFFLKQRKS